MPKISRAKLLAAATTVLVLLLACNLELLPLALLVDTIGLDVLALLLGAQLVAVLPWLRAHIAGGMSIVRLGAGAALTGFMGGYLRCLWMELSCRTALMRWQNAFLHRQSQA
ncbi:hypothetical protein [Stenotrophomonas sp. PS02300]|uniref:hypothetical protein n=1 Tax=Stenotrophomonas sp. PS02300 TaxID=2991426 RepID=UPI00249BB0D7|nr:hypothetical protein [Stenotrophomonas sp. PS02300]